MKFNVDESRDLINTVPKFRICVTGECSVNVEVLYSFASNAWGLTP